MKAWHCNVLILQGWSNHSMPKWRRGEILVFIIRTQKKASGTCPLIQGMQRFAWALAMLGPSHSKALLWNRIYGLRMVVLDASKVFDRVSHNTLFSILEKRGVYIPHLLLRFLWSWYKSQSCAVKWNACVFRYKRVWTLCYSEHNLQFNAAKTQLICFHSSPKMKFTGKFFFSGHLLEFLDTVTHLGHVLYTLLTRWWSRY